MRHLTVVASAVPYLMYYSITQRTVCTCAWCMHAGMHSSTPVYIGNDRLESAGLHQSIASLTFAKPTQPNICTTGHTVLFCNITCLRPSWPLNPLPVPSDCLRPSCLLHAAAFRRYAQLAAVSRDQSH